MHDSKLLRLICLMLALCTALTLLASCGTQDEPSDPIITDDPNAPAEPAEPDPAPETPEEPIADPDLFVPEGNVNPLTGLCDGISDEALERRPIAVMINNMIKALPQWGISQADIIYEMLAEGRITRLLAIFQDYSKIEYLASVRSARPYYLELALGHDALFVHAGGSPEAYRDISGRRI